MEVAAGHAGYLAVSKTERSANNFNLSDQPRGGETPWSGLGNAHCRHDDRGAETAPMYAHSPVISSYRHNTGREAS